MLYTGGYVDLIFRPCRPSQVLNSIVCLDAVDVIYITLVLGVRNECRRNKAMNSCCLSYTIHIEEDLPISSCIESKFQHPSIAPYIPGVADLVFGVINDRSPLLHWIIDPCIIFIRFRKNEIYVSTGNDKASEQDDPHLLLHCSC